MRRYPSKDPDHNLWTLIFQTQRALLKVRSRELDRYGLSPRQSAMLFIINAFKGDITIAEIGLWLLLEPHSVSETISRMERYGLVKKNRVARRRINIVLNQKGEEVFLQSNERQSVHDTISCLYGEERQQLGSILQKLRNRAVREIPWGYELTFEPI